MWNLVKTLNAQLKSGQLDEPRLVKAFNINWPIFEQEFAVAREKHPASEMTAPRPQTSVLFEILELTRTLNQRVSTIEARQLAEFQVQSTLELAKAIGRQGTANQVPTTRIADQFLSDPKIPFSVPATVNIKEIIDKVLERGTPGFQVEGKPKDKPK
jgi:hypothetical protein